jgi:Leucine-rich repeat (LRR) protein
MKLHEFPNGLLGLKQLRILDLSQNNLTTVPEVIVKISLQGCRIFGSFNKISFDFLVLVLRIEMFI